MTVSSRTPEGIPSECPLCGTKTNIEFSNPGADAPCPVCGCLIWESSEILQALMFHCENQLGVEAGTISVDSRILEDLGADSLDIAELVMEFEEEFDISIPDNFTEGIQTIRDVLRYIVSAR